MNHKAIVRRVAAVIVLLIAAVFGAETSFTADQITDILQKFRSYDYPSDPSAIGEIEDVIRFVIDKPELRELTEQRMIELLESDATTRARQFICHQLWIIGSDKSVKTLEAMLLDENTAEIACFALRTNPCETAGQALVRSLDKVNDSTKVRIIDALGRRRQAEAVFDLIRLLETANPEVARAAAMALGDIGGDRSTRAIVNARQTASGSMRSVLTRSLLRCAEYYTRNERPDVAMEIYAQLIASDEPVAVRRAAVVSAMNTGDSRATDLLSEAIKQANPQIRAAAVGSSYLLPDPQATAVLVESMETADVETQTLIVEALGRRDFQTVKGAVFAAAGSKWQLVRIAAYNVLAGSGETTSASLLCNALGESPDQIELDVIIACLKRISGKDINRTIFQAIDGAGPDARMRLIEVIGDRGYRVVVPSLSDYARDGDAELSLTALRAIEKLGGCQGIGRLIDIMLLRKEEDVRQAAAAAIVAGAGRSNYLEPTGRLILERLADVKSVTDRCSLMRILANTPGDDVLRYLQSAVKDSDAEVRDCAVRTLARYPGSGAAGTLLDVFETTKIPGHRMVALQGCVRLCRTTDIDAASAASFYSRAMAAAGSAAEKRLVLSGAATVARPEMLQIALEAMKDQAVKAEASLAAIALAQEMVSTNPREASDAARTVLSDSSLKNLHPKAQAVIEKAGNRTK